MSLLKTQVSFPSIFNVIKHNFFYTFLAQTYTFVLTKTRNEPKRPETSQEWVETTQNVKMLKLGKFGVFYQLSFFKFWAQMPYFRNFGPKSINFLIFTKLRIYILFWMHWFQICHLFLKLPKSPNLGIFGQKYQLSNLYEILPVSYFEGADFRSDFRIQKLWNFITSLVKINYFAFWFYLLN